MTSKVKGLTGNDYFEKKKKRNFWLTVGEIGTVILFFATLFFVLRFL